MFALVNRAQARLEIAAPSPTATPSNDANKSSPL
jgi:hypothetical protein